MNKIIEINNLTKSYETKYIKTVALNDLSISVNEGEFVSIMGPSGCGKSTLMSVMGLLDDFDSGVLRLGGHDVSNLSLDQKAKLRAKQIGFVFQSFNLIDSMTVFDNIALPLEYQGVGKSEIKTKVTNILDKVGLASRIHHKPNQLSGGQQQRVAIARALVCEPIVLLVDEPTGNLDSMSGDKIMQLLIELNASGTTIVMVTHDPRYSQCAQRHFHLVDGQLVSESYNNNMEVVENNQEVAYVANR